MNKAAFPFRHMSLPAPSSLVTLALAAIAVAIGAGVRIAFAAELGQRATYIFFVPAVVVASALSGLRGGIVACIAGAAAGLLCDRAIAPLEAGSLIAAAAFVIIGLAVALGGVGITLTDLVQSYAALARLGDPVRLSPLPTRTAEPLPRLFSPEAAWLAADILAGLPPPANAPAGRIAYKTGTSYGHRDAWAVGFDGSHVAGVWMGRADGASVPGAFGGELAAPILFDTFARLKPLLDPLPPPPPPPPRCI